MVLAGGQRHTRRQLACPGRNRRKDRQADRAEQRKRALLCGDGILRLLPNGAAGRIGSAKLSPRHAANSRARFRISTLSCPPFSPPACGFPIRVRRNRAASLMVWSPSAVICPCRVCCWLTETLFFHGPTIRSPGGPLTRAPFLNWTDFTSREVWRESCANASSRSRWIAPSER